jgi:hypothetical protein
MKNVIEMLMNEWKPLFSKSLAEGVTSEERARLNELEKAIKTLEGAQKEEEAKAPKQPKVLRTREYSIKHYGLSMFSGERVLIQGEQTVELEDGRVIEQYLYDIVGHTPANGKPFAALKANIVLE